MSNRLYMNSISKVRVGLDKVGLYGIIKSVYNSLRYTSNLHKLLFHSNTIVEISQGTEFDINNRFEVGIGKRGATHPLISRSKFSTLPGSSVSHTGKNSANIGPGSVVHIEGDFSMGDSYINSHSRILCGDEITIGDDVAISWNCEILDDDRHQIIVDGERPARTGPIEIQDGVWIGHNVSVHKGVTIGNGSVVASDSVVLSNVPSNTLVAGCPAEIVRENIDWE